MFGAFLGDFVGSAYENIDLKGYNLPLVTNLSYFTDDSIMTAATICSLRDKVPFDIALREWCLPRLDMGFSQTLKDWVNGEYIFEHSSGNGAAIRVAPIAYYCDSIDNLFSIAESNARLTHDNDDAINGAKAQALAVYLSLHGHGSEEIVASIEKHFSYDINYNMDELHKSYTFTTEAKSTVPIAIYISSIATSVEDLLRKGLHIGGDVDSILSMACAIYMASDNSVPDNIKDKLLLKARISDPELHQIILGTLR